MKIAKALIAVVVLGGLFTLSNCGSSSPTPEPLANQQFTKLQKTWKLTGATLGSVSQFGTGQPYNGNFTLTISGTKGAASFDYSVAGRPALSVWKASGKWTFGADVSTQLVRDPDIATDKLDMTYSVTDSQLQIQFTFPKNKSGYTRTDQVEGDWVFTFGL